MSDLGKIKRLPNVVIGLSVRKAGPYTFLIFSICSSNVSNFGYFENAMLMSFSGCIVSSKQGIFPIKL
jgi:hypothetical protein